MTQDNKKINRDTQRLVAQGCLYGLLVAFLIGCAALSQCTRLCQTSREKHGVSVVRGMNSRAR